MRTRLFVKMSQRLACGLFFLAAVVSTPLVGAEDAITISFSYQQGMRFIVEQSREGWFTTKHQLQDNTLTTSTRQTLKENYANSILKVDSDSRPIELDRMYTVAEKTLARDEETLTPPPPTYLGEMVHFRKQSLLWTATCTEGFLSEDDRLSILADFHWEDLLPCVQINQTPLPLESVDLAQLLQIDLKRFQIDKQDATIHLSAIKNGIATITLIASLTGTMKSDSTLILSAQLNAELQLHLEDGYLPSGTWSGKVVCTSSEKATTPVDYEMGFKGSFKAKPE